MRIPRWAGLSWPPVVLKRVAINAWAATAALALCQSPALAQESHNVTLHANPRWMQCSFQLDRSLTQSAWYQFTREPGVVTYFRPLADARPMGAGKYEVFVAQWQTAIDDTDPAWNDTFMHPDSMHWLFEGSGLKFPGLMVRAGLTDRTDAGFYLTKGAEANYGFKARRCNRTSCRTRSTTGRRPPA